MIVAAVGVMAALVTLAVALNRGPESYADGTPEASLQQFISAAFDDDHGAMLALLRRRKGALRRRAR